MNLFGYTYKIYDIGYKTEMMSKECNSGDPLETPGGLYRGPRMDNVDDASTTFVDLYLDVDIPILLIWKIWRFVITSW